MNDHLFTIVVAGAWSYRVVVTDDALEDRNGRRAGGGFDSLDSEIVLAERQSADAAIGSLAHEFVHAWRHHLSYDRSTVIDAMRKLAASDPELRRVLDDGPAESDATMLCCWLRECLRLDVPGILAKRFGAMPVCNVRDIVISVGARAAAGDVGEVVAEVVAEVEAAESVRYLPDLDTHDWQRRLGQSGSRCECPRCGKTINAATVLVGEPKINLRLHGQVADCMFVCDGCGMGVKWKSPYPVPANFDSTLNHDIELLTGRQAEDAMLAIMGPVIATG